MLNIEKEFIGTKYYEFIDLAFEVCDTFILVLRHNMGRENSLEKILEKLEDSLIEVKEESEWPSTKLLRGTATVYYYKTEDNAKEVIKNVSNSLYEWAQPERPEDLCFFKKGKPWLANSAHERFSFVDTELEEEIEKLLKLM